jgi:replicative DNA helicase
MYDNAERALVGLAMGRPEVVQAAISAGITPRHFGDGELREVWVEILRAEREQRPFDALNLRPFLPNTFASVLIGLEQDAPIGSLPSFFIDELLHAAWLQELQVALKQAISAASSRHPFAEIEPVKELVMALGERCSENKRRKSSYTAAELWTATENVIEERIRIHQAGGRIGTPTGYPKLDDCIHGLVGGRLIVVGARPKVGKTTFSLNLAYNAAAAGDPVAYFTYEMTAAELGMKVVSITTGVPTSDLALGRASDADLMRLLRFTMNDGQTLPLFVDEMTDRSFEHLMYRARQRIRTSKAKVIFVDYVGLLNVTAKQFIHQRPLEVAHMTSQLKQLAQEENVCVVAIAQINRKGAETEEPQLHHLKESGSYEQDADHCLLLWRDEHGNFIVSVAANRHGPAGDLRLVAKLDTSRIVDPEVERLGR